MSTWTPTATMSSPRADASSPRRPSASVTTTTTTASPSPSAARPPSTAPARPAAKRGRPRSSIATRSGSGADSGAAAAAVAPRRQGNRKCSSCPRATPHDTCRANDDVSTPPRKRSRTTARPPSPPVTMVSNYTDDDRRRLEMRRALLARARARPLITRCLVPQAPPCLITNLVSTFRLAPTAEQWVDLQYVAMHARDRCPAKYQSLQFAAMRMMVRLHRSGRATKALLFAKGVVVLMGAHSEEDSLHTAWALSQYFRRPVAQGGLGIHWARVHDFRVHNMVAWFNCGAPVDLQALYECFPGRAECELARIRCCRIRLGTSREQSKQVVLVFQTGLGIVTGVKTRADIVRNFAEVYAAVRALWARSAPTVAAVRGHSVETWRREARVHSRVSEFERLMEERGQALRLRQQSFVRTDTAGGLAPAELALPGALRRLGGSVPHFAPLNPFGEDAEAYSASARRHTARLADAAAATAEEEDAFHNVLALLDGPALDEHDVPESAVTRVRAEELAAATAADVGAQ